MFVVDWCKSPRRLEVENLFLRHQLNIALRRAPHRLRLRGSDRAILVWMTWLWPSLLGLSRESCGGIEQGFEPTISKENPLRGAPRIHGELLKLGFEIAESTVGSFGTITRIVMNSLRPVSSTSTVTERFSRPADPVEATFH